MASADRRCDPAEDGRRSSPAAEKIALALLLAAVAFTNAVWIIRDTSLSPIGDTYLYLMRLLRFVDGFATTTLADPLAALGQLSAGGRPPLYQLLTVPFIAILGRSEDSATAVNLLFLALLLLAVYQMGRLVEDGSAGLLAAVLVVSYPPVLQLSRVYLPHFAVPACAATSLWLLLRLIARRSARTAWLFGASLGFGLLVHPHFVWVLAVPTTLVGLYLLLFQTGPRRPARLGAAPAWLWAKLRDPFVVRGLAPGALLSLLMAVPWYLTRGRTLPRLLYELSSAEVAEFRGRAVIVHGFPDTPVSFWWYLRTAPQALSYVLFVLLLAAAGSALVRRRGPVTVLLTTLASTYVLLSLLSTRAWWLFAAVLPVAAVLTACWIRGLRHPRLAAGLTALCLVAAIANFAVVTWGDGAPARTLATALGSPALSATCSDRSAFVLCPNPARVEAESWPVGEILATMIEDGRCEEQTCRLMLLKMGEMTWPYFNFYVVQNWPRSRLITADQSSPFAGLPYNLRALLESDYVLFPAARAVGSSYHAASIRFLISPPPAFAAAHRELAVFELPDGTPARLLKRVRPLTSAEAEASIQALDLPERYKTQKFEILAGLYAAEGRAADDVGLFEEALRRAASPRTRAKLRRALADSYFEQGQAERGLALLREALEADPRDLYARVRIANFYRANGEPERAVAELETAISHAPDAIWPRIILGKTYQSIGEDDRAVSLYQEIIKIDPEHAGARQALAKLNAAASRRR